MRGFALDLIKKSAEQASARLQFCRLAFGAAGSAGASIDTGDAEKVARGLFGGERTQLAWNVPCLLMPKNKVKLILNLCLIAASAIPRGGIIEVTLSSEEPARISVTPRHQCQARRPVAGAPHGTPDQHPPARRTFRPIMRGLSPRPRTWF